MDEEVTHWQLAIMPKRLAVRSVSAAITYPYGGFDHIRQYKPPFAL